MAKKFQKDKNSLILLNIIRFASYIILFTPLIVNRNFFFPFVGPKSLYFMGLAEIIFFSWLILVSINSNYRPQINPLLLALILYLFVFTLASIFGVNFSYSFWSKYERMTGLLMQLHLFGFFLVLSSVFKEEDFKKFFGFSVFVAIIASLIALLNLKNPSMRGGGPLGNESFLGTYLIFNLFFALFLIFKTQGLSKKLSLIAFLILTISIFLIGVHLENLSFSQKISAILHKSGARAAKLSFLGGLVLFFLFWLVSSQKKILKIIGFLLLISSFISAGYFIFSAPQSGSFVRKLIEKEVGESFGGRFVVWQGAWKGFLERKWLGWGPENFEFSFTKYYNPCMPTSRCGGEIWFDRAHNIIFDTLISTGILGMVSYLLIFAASFYILWKNFLKKKTDFWSAGIFTSLFIAYFVQNLTVFDMVSSYLMFFLSLAFIASLEKKENLQEAKITNLNPLIFSLIFIIFIFSFTFFVIQPTINDVNVISAIKPPPFSKEQLSLFKRTLSLSPLGKFQIRQFFVEQTLNKLYSAQLPNKNTKEEIEFLIQEMRKTIKESPLDYRSYLRLGQLLNFYSQIESNKILEAEEILKKAIEISPTNQQGYWQLSQNMLFQRKFEEALNLVEKAVKLEPKLLQSHLIVIQVAKIIGDNELVEKKIKEAIEIDPSWESEIKKILKDS